jgi:hypothetical protein
MGDQKINPVLIWILLGVALLFLVGLVYRPVLLLLLFVVALSLFFGGSYFLVMNLGKKKQKQDKSEDVVEDIRIMVQRCEDERTKHQNEVSDIRTSIREIERSMDSIDEMHPGNRAESKRILAGFYKELDLRNTKVDFYETCQLKLETLLHNYLFSKKLEEKQSRLKELQENHHEDLATMESFRSDLEYNKRFLETIETLSLKMLSSNSLDTAQQLKLELKMVTEELRKM